MLIIDILATIFLVYLVLNVGYLLLFSLAGKLPAVNAEKTAANQESFLNIAVFIPGYKEDTVILDTAQEALRQTYPAAHYDVIVIADSLKEETLEQLRAKPIRLIEVKFEKSTKAKALNKAMTILEKPYNLAVILDADNIMAPDFLYRVNRAFHSGIQVLQGHRTAKNTETPFAVLDAVSEEINNHIFRKGHQRLGLSAALIGSGMAFDYSLFRKTMSEIDAISGFDKELEINLLQRGYRIFYLEDAYVLDEKVARPETFDKQRTRWIAAQIYYAKKAGIPALKMLFTRGNIDLFNKVLQFWMLPRVILLGLLTLLLPLSFFISYGWLLALLWAVLFLALVIAVPKTLAKQSLLPAMLQLPRAFFLMIKASFQIKQAKKRFLHTPHHTTSGKAEKEESREKHVK